MDWKRALAFGCCGCAGLLLIGIIVLVVIGAHASKEPEGVRVAIEAPPSVPVDSEFTLAVIVKNERAEPFPLTDIDLADEYLAGFVLVSTSPEPKSSMHVPLDNTRSFNFDTPVPPGETARFEFRLRATTPGKFEGDADVCEGTRFLSALIQTHVAAAPGATPAPTGATAP